MDADVDQGRDEVESAENRERVVRPKVEAQ